MLFRGMLCSSILYQECLRCELREYAPRPWPDLVLYRLSRQVSMLNADAWKGAKYIQKNRETGEVLVP